VHLLELLARAVLCVSSAMFGATLGFVALRLVGVNRNPWL
jgi:hypothetical protein